MKQFMSLSLISLHDEHSGTADLQVRKSHPKVKGNKANIRTINSKMTTGYKFLRHNYTIQRNTAYHSLKIHNIV